MNTPGEKQVFVDGRTDQGVHVRVLEGEGGYSERFEVYVDGEPVSYSDVSRMRDGGTTTIKTELGQLYAYRGIGRPHWSTWDGEPLR